MRLVTAHTYVGVPFHVHVWPVGVLVTVYFVMVIFPGVGVGAVHLTVALATPSTAVGVPGGPGIVAGMRWTGREGEPVPAWLVALTLNPYVTPFVNPEMVHERAPKVAQALDVLVFVTV